MAKSKAQFEMSSFGLYEGWDNKSKELPSIRNCMQDTHRTKEISSNGKI